MSPYRKDAPRDAITRHVEPLRVLAVPPSVVALD